MREGHNGAGGEGWGVRGTAPIFYFSQKTEPVKSLGIVNKSCVSKWRRPGWGQSRSGRIWLVPKMFFWSPTQEILNVFANEIPFVSDAMKVLPTYFLGLAKITAGALLYTSWLFPLFPLYFFRVSKITAGALRYTYWIFRYESTTHVLSSPRQDDRWSSAVYLLAFPPFTLVIFPRVQDYRWSSAVYLLDFPL